MRNAAIFSLLLCAAGGCKDPPTTSVTLAIDGMVCESCAQAIQRELAHMDGVGAAQVTYKTRRAFVTYAPSKVAPEALIEAIRKLGYKAHVRARMARDGV